MDRDKLSQLEYQRVKRVVVLYLYKRRQYMRGRAGSVGVAHKTSGIIFSSQRAQPFSQRLKRTFLRVNRWLGRAISIRALSLCLPHPVLSTAHRCYPALFRFSLG